MISNIHFSSQGVVSKTKHKEQRRVNRRKRRIATAIYSAMLESRPIRLPKGVSWNEFKDNVLGLGQTWLGELKKRKALGPMHSKSLSARVVELIPTKVVLADSLGVAPTKHTSTKALLDLARQRLAQNLGMPPHSSWVKLRDREAFIKEDQWRKDNALELGLPEDTPLGKVLEKRRLRDTQERRIMYRTMGMYTLLAKKLGLETDAKPFDVIKELKKLNDTNGLNTNGLKQKSILRSILGDLFLDNVV